MRLDHLLSREGLRERLGLELNPLYEKSSCSGHEVVVVCFIEFLVTPQLLRGIPGL